MKSALDFKETARNNGQVDRAIESASRSVEGLCRRRFYPQTTTRHFDWPNEQAARSYRLWLDPNGVITVTSLTSGGVLLDPADYNLRRSDNLDEPPYTRIEIDLSTDASFSVGATFQRSIAVTGLFGYRNDETTLGTVIEDLDAAETGVDVDAATSAAVGVGSVLRVDAERMIVTARTQLSTGQTLQTPMTAQNNNETVAVTDGTQYAVGEVITLDTERMLIVDIAGNSLLVKRAWDGSTLAAHTGSTIYAPRTLTVTRGALGTTPASHTPAATVHRWDPPGLVHQLTVAEALNDLLQNASGYARVVGSGENEREMSGRGLRDIRSRTFAAHGRVRMEAV
ncbi:hypothetical protein [Streptomyces pseudogriseolus]|uniref:hypothetical protein n=1 Tax=Streptomyces pseudogriseolus TaxID=36817 RepID=UPI003FA2B605